MLPLFPSLMPPITNSLWFDIDPVCDEEAEVQAMENEHQNWLNAISQTAQDLNPIGGPFTEQLDNDSDDEDQDGELNDFSFWVPKRENKKNLWVQFRG